MPLCIILGYMLVAYSHVRRRWTLLHRCGCSYRIPAVSESWLNKFSLISKRLWNINRRSESIKAKRVASHAFKCPATLSRHQPALICPCDKYARIQNIYATVPVRYFNACYHNFTHLNPIANPIEMYLLICLILRPQTPHANQPLKQKCNTNSSLSQFSCLPCRQTLY